MKHAVLQRSPSPSQAVQSLGIAAARPWLLAAALLVGPAAASPAAQQAELITPAAVPNVGAKAKFVATSPDGRFVVFESNERNVVPGQVSAVGAENLFLFDRVLGTTALITHTGDGVTASTDGTDDQEASISTDGGLVAFLTEKKDLVAGFVPASQHRPQIYLYDVATGEITLVSHSADDPLKGGDSTSGRPRLSGDGATLVFESNARDLNAGFSTTQNHIYAFDVASGTRSLLTHAVGDPSTEGTGWSTRCELSRDGSTVVFQSGADNLVSGFAHSAAPVANVFALDLASGTATLVSHVEASPTTGGDQNSIAPSVSHDGQRIAYASGASNLINGFTDNSPGFAQEIYYYDVATGANALVSSAAGSDTTTGDNRADLGFVSGDGSAVAFVSLASDHVSGATDSNNTWDAFLYNVATGDTTLVTRSAANSSLAAEAGGYPAIALSADGTVVAYESYSTNLVAGFATISDDPSNIYRFDATTGVATLVSRALGSSTQAGDSGSSFGSMSDDGDTVFYSSESSNLVTPMIHDRALFAYSATSQANEIAAPILGTPSITSNDETEIDTKFAVSDDGRFVLFDNESSNLIAGFQYFGQDGDDVYLYDRQTETLSLVSHTGDGLTRSNPSPVPNYVISGDGSTVAFTSTSFELVPGYSNTDHKSNLYVYDVATASVTLATNDALAPTVGGDGHSDDRVTISRNGRWIAYATQATNMVTGVLDTNSAHDVYVYDVQQDTHTLVSRSTSGALSTSNGSSRRPRINGGGDTIVFESTGTDLVVDFVNANGAARDLYTYDVATGSISLLSRKHDDASSGGDGDSFGAEIADTGAVSFASMASDLVDGFVDGNGSFSFDTFVASGGAIALVTHTAGDPLTGADWPADDPRISGDGSTIVFDSRATDLVAGFVDANGPSSADVYRYDVATGTNTLVSHVPGLATTGGSGSSQEAFLSYDGDRIGYESGSSDLVTGQVDTNDDWDVFAYVHSTDTTILVSHVPGSPTTTGSDEESEEVRMSADGSLFFFEGESAQLVPADQNGADLNGDDDAFAFFLPLPGCEPEVYCTSAGSITIEGTQSLAANDTVLTVSGVPNDFGIFIMGGEQAVLQNPICGAAGTLCIGGQITRLCPEVLASGNTNSLALDFADELRPEAAITAGQSWNFQYWYRMPGGCSFSDAISACFVH